MELEELEPVMVMIFTLLVLYAAYLAAHIDPDVVWRAQRTMLLYAIVFAALLAAPAVYECVKMKVSAMLRRVVRREG